MLTEREYRIACIRERFPALNGCRVVIYGTGINARLIIDHAREMINLIGLMDENQTGRELYGYRVLSQEEVIEKAVDVIVIAAKIDSAIAVYKRIAGFCDEHDIDVYDLYGNHVKALLHSIVEMCSESYEAHKEGPDLYGSLRDSIDASDVVSIDLNTLFSETKPNVVLLQEVWNSRFRRGAKAFAELRLRSGCQQEKSYGSLQSIYGVLQSYLCVSETDAKALAETELNYRADSFQMHPGMQRVIQTIVSNRKTLVLINESVFPTDFWRSQLEKYGIQPDSYTLLNRSESGHNKFNGLYRELFDYYPGKQYLHIGNDYDADGIAPSVYGFQSVVLQKCSTDHLVKERTEEKSGFPLELLQECCTDLVEYSVVNCRFEDYLKLKICDSYYVLIHKDANLTPGWLEQLVGTAECHKEATLVCSRVRGEDGTILYAGEMVGEDVTGQKSQMVSGFLPVYDYVRSVSQICIVSFLVRKENWDIVESHRLELQTTLKMYLASAECPVAVYQPLSEVIYNPLMHTVLPMETVCISERPKILVTDNLLTKFDRDAGSRCTWFYLRQFHKLGFEVTLMAQNFDEVQPYVMQIQQAGIRVIYGDYYRSNWKNWLGEEGDSFRYIYMQRPESTSFFLSEIRKHCIRAKIFYFAHDLHFLRLSREYEITGNPDHLRSAEQSKTQECSLIEIADVVHVVGSYEQEYLQNLYPEKKIRNIPLYIYEQTDDKQILDYHIADRKDLLYVGSFGHPPNLDAALWFAEQILPGIVKQHPDIVWHVVGSNPPVEVQQYAGKNLVLHGFLSDEELSELYQACRIVVVPLRYGAGVKGKILEASYYQVPIVTTSIGAEGIPQDEHNMIVCDTAEDFAEAVSNLYTDEARLRTMALGGWNLIRKHYTEGAVNAVLRLDMPELKKDFVKTESDTV